MKNDTTPMDNKTKKIIWLACKAEAITRALTDGPRTLRDLADLPACAGLSPLDLAVMRRVESLIPGEHITPQVGGGTDLAMMRTSSSVVPAAASLVDLDIDDWRRVLDVNLTGTLLAIQSTASVMLDQGKPGSIVTIASIAAKDPLWGSPSYPVSKAGVWMLTKNAARTLAPLGIRVNAIGPGFIETNMTAVLGEVDEYNNMILGLTPMGRKGKPSEIASVALFLASDDASYMTGELLHPDGGWFTG